MKMRSLRSRNELTRVEGVQSLYCMLYIHSIKGGISGAPLKPLRDDSVLKALSSLRGLRGAPAEPPLCRETQSLGQQMLNATVGKNGLRVSRMKFMQRPGVQPSEKLASLGIIGAQPRAPLKPLLHQRG